MDVFVVPEECDKLLRVSLPRPKDNQLQHYLYDDENLALYEITKYSDQFRSWFLGNLFSKDGHMNILTRVDPLFIFIPILIKFSSTQFRTLHDICQTYSSNSVEGSSKIDYALSPNINWERICDTKEIDGELFVKFNQDKTMDWLLIKHERTMEAMKKVMSDQTSRATLISYANDLIDIYLPPTLSEKFKTLTRATNAMGVKQVEEKEPKPLPSKNKTSKRTSDQSDNKTKLAKGTILQFFKK